MKNNYLLFLLLWSNMLIIGCQSDTTKDNANTKNTDSAPLQSGWLPEEYKPEDLALVQLLDSAMMLHTSALMNPAMEAALREHALKAAFDLLQNILEKDPEYGLAYSNLAAIYLEFGDTLKAIDAIKRRLNKEPQFAEGWQAAGFFYDKTGDSSTAFDYYKKSIDCFDNRLKMGKVYTNPNDILYFYDNTAGKAYSLLLLGQTEAAHKATRELLEEAGPFLGEEADIYATLLTTNRWQMLTEAD